MGYRGQAGGCWLRRARHLVSGSDHGWRVSVFFLRAAVQEELNRDPGSGIRDPGSGIRDPAPGSIHSPSYVANEVGVSHTRTFTMSMPSSRPLSKISRAMR